MKNVCCSSRRRPGTPVSVFLTTLLWAALSCQVAVASNPPQPPKLLDLSGIAWTGGDRFITVSYAKIPEEDEFGRICLLPPLETL